jgi:osmotically-inducible protein OsmY
MLYIASVDTNKTKLQLIAAIFAVVLIAPAAWAVQPDSKDVTSMFANSGIALDGLRAVDVGGILVLRGTATDQTQAEAVSAYAKTLGYTRIANLVRVDATVDDAAIERSVERQIALAGGLDGCSIKVNSKSGAVHVTGTVQHELQKDYAVQVIRNVDGVKSVQSDLQRF